MTLHSQSKNIKGFEEAHDDDHRTVFPEPTLEDDTTSREVEHDSDVIIDREEPSILSHHLDSPNHQHTTSVEFSPVSPTLMSISTAKARNRSFLVGSANSWGSLLGTGHLNLYFPERKVAVFVGTWNMNEVGEVDQQLEDFLLPISLENVPDIYAIGTQENVLPKQEWEVILQETIGFSHVLLHSVNLGVLHLAVFIRRELIWFCSDPEDSFISTRQGTVIKTKGAVAIAFQFFGTSFLFINCHLTAHDGNIKERISDYEKIREGLELPNKIKAKGICNTKDVTSKFDCVYWFGDLNFRINHEQNEVLASINSSSSNYHSLLKADQLITAMRNGDAFCGFEEPSLRFLPTFKFDVGTDVFDTSEKHRTPAYTDRILYRIKKKDMTVCIQYNSVPTIRMSDHKPVFAAYDTMLRAGRDDIPLAAGLFNRSVYLKALSRRAVNLNPLLNQKSSRFCSVM